MESKEIDQVFDLDFLDRISYRLNQIPTSTIGRFYKKYNHKLAIICDEFTFNAFKDVAQTVVLLHPEHWLSQISEATLLIIASTWNGLNREWRGLYNENHGNTKIIRKIIEYCKLSKIPTVFYSKEDPIDYKSFLNIAIQCEYVFTSAAEIVPLYKKDCKHDQVYSLMFGINPLYHNPVGSCSKAKLQGVVFSGSWYERFPERNNDMRSIFEGVLSSSRGLKIIDRNFESTTSEFKFPNDYSRYISPAIPHELLQKVHKLYDWAININTVKYSQTMFANRVFELVAAGSLVLSNFSIGISLNLPTVYIAQNSEEVTKILDSLTPDEIKERQAQGIRHVMTGHTCVDRYSQILETIGLFAMSQVRNVAVVVKEVNEAVLSKFERQSYPHKFMLTENQLSARYGDFDIITFFSESMEYGEFYLEDMINAFKYTDCDYITKSSYHVCNGLINGRQHDFVSSMPSKYCVVFWANSFFAQTLLDLPKNSCIQMPNGYSIDYLQFNMGQ